MIEVGVDVLLIGLLALVLRKLGDDRSHLWREREAALRAIFEDLRGAVAQAEGLAHDLDRKLEAHATELRGLLANAPREHDCSHEVQRLAREDVPIDEIARRLDVSSAEVRVLIGLDAAAGRQQ